MHQVDLTELSQQELRQRLNSSRARGDAAVAYEILREMAARRETRASRRPMIRRRQAEAHVVTLELGDPMDEDGLPPFWRRAAAPAAEAPAALPEDSAPEDSVAVSAPAQRPSRRKAKRSPPAPLCEIALEADETPSPVVALANTEPLGLTLDEPEPSLVDADPADDALRLHPEVTASRRPPAQTHMWVAAGFALGISAGVALGWWAAMTHDTPSRPAVEVASQARAPAQASHMLDVSLARTAVAPRQAGGPAVAPSPSPPSAAPSVDSAALGPDYAEAAEPPSPGSVATTADSAPVTTAGLERTSAAPEGACAAEPTPADREICADPALRRLQRELRRAYAEALDAHQDRALLRQRQLAWREARNTISAPDRLARLYEQRIARLNAATAEARAQR